MKLEQDTWDNELWFRAFYNVKKYEGRTCRSAVGVQPIIGGWFDHGRTWEGTDGCAIFTAEPYRLNSEDMGDIVRVCEANGLRATVHPPSKSLWNSHPTEGCFLIVLEPEGRL